MKITAIETIPVDLPVEKFQDGDDKVWAINAPERYPTGENAGRPRALKPEGNRVKSNVIVKIHTVADVINTKCAKAGGIRGVEQWATVAEAAGLPILIGTEWGAGLKVAAKLHLGAAIKNADPVVEFTEIMIHELLLQEPLELQDGYLAVPTGPGLGLAYDDAKIEMFRTSA